MQSLGGSGRVDKQHASTILFLQPVDALRLSTLRPIPSPLQGEG